MGGAAPAQALLGHDENEESCARAVNLREIQPGMVVVIR